MGSGIASALAVAALALAGCGGDGERVPMEQIGGVRETESGQPLLPQSIVVELDSVGGSGQRGTATLAPVGGGGRTRVTLDLASAGDGDQRAHVHRGTCTELGEVVAELEPAAGRSSTTTLDVPLQRLVEDEGRIAVDVHAPDGGAVAACGEVPAVTTP